MWRTSTSSTTNLLMWLARPWEEKDIIYCEKFIAEHSTWPRRKFVTSSGLGIPQQTTRRAIDINIAYLIFVIFFTLAKFLENKIYTKKTHKLRQIHSKLPIFCIITAEYTVNCQIFALNLKKFTPAKKIYTNIFVGFVTNMRYEVYKRNMQWAGPGAG